MSPTAVQTQTVNPGDLIDPFPFLCSLGTDQYRTSPSQEYFAVQGFSNKLVFFVCLFVFS